MIGQTDQARAADRRSRFIVWRGIGLQVIAMSCLFASLLGTAAAADEAISNPVEGQSLQALTATHERPLFSPTRRPVPKVVAPVAVARPEPPPAPPPGIVLLGIVSENGEARAAIRSTDKRPADKVLRVRAGDDVSGWKVERIEPRRLVLTQGERSADFLLFGAAGKTVRSADAAIRARPER